uniref:Uncharacterized protein n=1 Tax=Equus asinus TaxID=9793 RepID=A0A8C4M5H1_EQUAS
MVGSKELTTKNGVGSSRKQGMAKKMIPEGANGHEVGGRSEAGREGVPGLFLPSATETRDRPAGPPGVPGTPSVVKAGVSVRSPAGKRCHIQIQQNLL